MDALKKAEQAKREADKPGRQDAPFPQQTLSSSSTIVPQNRSDEKPEFSLDLEPLGSTGQKHNNKQEANDEFTLRNNGIQDTESRDSAKLGLESGSEHLDTRSGISCLKDDISQGILPEEYAAQPPKNDNPKEDVPLLDGFDYMDCSAEPVVVHEHPQPLSIGDTKPTFNGLDNPQAGTAEIVPGAQPQTVAKQAQKASPSIKHEPATASPEAAEQLFNAKAFPIRSRRATRFMLSAILVFFTVFAGGGYYYYYTMSELLAKKVAMPLPVTTSVTPVASTEPTSMLEIVRENQAARKEPKAEISRKISSVQQITKPIAKPAVAKIQQPSSTTQKKFEIHQPKLAKAVPAPTEVRAAAPIKIERELEPDRAYQLLQQAYEDFRRGNDINARTAYRKVLLQDATNRDALLGLAAINVRHKNFELALDKYLQLLNQNPKDPVAIAALINMKENG